MKTVVAEVHRQIASPIETVFDVITPIDLSTIMTGYGPFPAVTGIEDQSGAWSEIGESRIVRLADGGGVLETLTATRRPHHFAYMVNELTSVLRFLISGFHGTWSFEEGERVGETQVVDARWRHEFVCHSYLTWPFVWILVTKFWQPYMAKALDLASDQAVAARG